MTYRYREFLIFLVVSEPVSEQIGTEKFDTGTEFRRQSLGILKIYNGYRYRESYIFLVVSEPVSDQIGTGKTSRYRYGKNLVPGKSLGTGIGKTWYRKKVSEPVSEKIGTGKKSRNRYRKNLIPELIFVAKT